MKLAVECERERAGGRDILVVAEFPAAEVAAGPVLYLAVRLGFGSLRAAFDIGIVVWGAAAVVVDMVAETVCPARIDEVRPGDAACLSVVAAVEDRGPFGIADREFVVVAVLRGIGFAVAVEVEVRLCGIADILIGRRDLAVAVREIPVNAETRVEDACSFAGFAGTDILCALRPRIAFDRVAWHAFAFPKSLADAVIVAVGHVFAACAFAVDACIGLAAFVPASATVVVRGHEVDAVAVGRAVWVFWIG
ncbi:MAG: hypothetical protein IJ165_09775 [Proteobacteria bacterium]|nr:hypothetical protein [Pseudomonadota bacterium]